MKLARLGLLGQERLAVITGKGEAVFVDDVSPILSRESLESGALDRIKALNLDSRKRVNTTGMRFGSPIARPTKIICVGLNYREHALESGASIPQEPVLFLKSPDTLQAPNDPILIPPNSTATDYEVELAIVIGKEASYLDSVELALGVIAGYAVSQDVSERYWQIERGGQWTKGKSFPTFNPLGPFKAWS